MFASLLLVLHSHIWADCQRQSMNQISNTKNQDQAKKKKGNNGINRDCIG